MTAPNNYSVDSTTRECCNGIGNHTPNCDHARTRLIWRIRDIMCRITPEDMTDAELTAAIAILSLADVRNSPQPVSITRA